MTTTADTKNALNRRTRIMRMAPWIAAALAATGVAQIQPATASPPTVWTQVASACTPDEASGGRYDVHTGDFKHKGIATGQIVTRCNVTALAARGRSMQVVFRDQDGPGTRQRVIATLVRANQNGTTTPIRTFNSNTLASSPLTRRAELPLSHNFTFGSAAYYVEFRVNRTTASTAGSTYPIATLVRLTAI